MNISKQAQAVIKNGIKNELRIAQTEDGSFLKGLIQKMQQITNEILSLERKQSKSYRYWNQQLSTIEDGHRIGLIGNTQAIIKEEAKNTILFNSQLNALESLIEIFGAYITQRPITSLVAYYQSDNQYYRIQVPANQYFLAREASGGHLRITLEGLQTLVKKEKALMTSENRLIKYMNEIKRIEKDYYNKGHAAEAYERIRKGHKKITDEYIKKQMQKSKGNVSWNKAGDTKDIQVKYLGTEGNQWANIRKTASETSIIELSDYIVNILQPALYKNINDIDETQVNAIYNAFVNEEEINFYHKGGFDQQVAEDIIKQINNKLGLTK